MTRDEIFNRYLNAAELHRWTPQTFLRYTLRGKAKDYTAGYRDRLFADIKDALAAGHIEPIESARGGQAYRERL